jgi:hypothetical protein
MADLVKVMDMVNKDLKALYKEKPGGAWLCPCVVFANNDGSTRVLDGNMPDDQLMPWMAMNLEPKKLDQIVVGRMVIKRGDIIDPTTNQLIIKEKAIMIMGKDMKNNRMRLIITPCKEHRDYRTAEEIETQAKLKAFDPSVKGADIDKVLVDNETGQFYARLTAKFGQEQIFDSRNGHTFLTDPIIAGMTELRNVKDDTAEDISDPTHHLRK